MAPPKKNNSPTIETRAMKISALEKAYPVKDPKTGEPVRHEWVDAYANLPFFVQLLTEHPDYQFGKTFPVSDKGRYSEVPDYWSQEIVYDKFRDGTSGYLKDAAGNVRTDVPIIRRYIIGRSDVQDKLISSLINMFGIFPDNFPNKEAILENLKAQYGKKRVSRPKAAPKPRLRVGDKQSIRVSPRSTNANISTSALFQAKFGDDFTFDQKQYRFVEVEFCDDDGPYFKVRATDRTELIQNK